MTLAAKVLTVSDGVVAGTREDRSGRMLAERLAGKGCGVVERRTVADGVESVAAALAAMAAGFAGLVVTTGGTGFTHATSLHEGTRQVLEREAGGLAGAVGLANPPKGRFWRAGRDGGGVPHPQHAGLLGGRHEDHWTRCSRCCPTPSICSPAARPAMSETDGMRRAIELAATVPRQHVRPTHGSEA